MSTTWKDQTATDKQIETIFNLFGKLGWPVKAAGLTKKQASDEIQSALKEMNSRHAIVGCLRPEFYYDDSCLYDPF